MLSGRDERTVGHMLIGSGFGFALGGATWISVGFGAVAVLFGVLLVRLGRWRPLLMNPRVLETAWKHGHEPEQRGFDYDIELWHEERTLQPFAFKVKFPDNPEPEMVFVLLTALGGRHAENENVKHSGKKVKVRIEQPVPPETKLRLMLKNCKQNVGRPKSAAFLYAGD